MADKDQLAAITFPDVDPNMLPEDSKYVPHNVLLLNFLLFFKDFASEKWFYSYY